ncbi:glucosamine-6-phosphate deaminase [Cyanobium gracile]|uniref:6-phosphogluconolactonase/glucosamine-6-phosphate isomerase/deaminase n=1 Tax=Cyanobium gracile (strain ATCC 27147 / PCC 6307) TaxID=292564 RepID=K9PAQ4_CYAGP|nr:6-phosphogluconolactonase/glucosamine-6-phosphate isomerase/deaminase [Cyanobium gracile PCC 6307]
MSRHAPSAPVAAPVTASIAPIVLADAAAVAERVAALLLADRLRPGRPLGLATGRTMEPVYTALARRLGRLEPALAAQVRHGWSSFNLDEYVGLGPHDPASFAATMARQLVQPLGLAPGRVRLPDGRAGDPDGEARRYGASVAAAGGIGLQLLGLGLNGHVGFNEPPAEAAVACRCVTLSDPTRRQNAGAFGGDPGAVPRRAITLGMAEILAARRVLLVVTGGAKAAILRRALWEPPTPELPASWLQHHPALTVIADAEAMG